MPTHRRAASRIARSGLRRVALALLVCLAAVLGPVRSASATEPQTLEQIIAGLGAPTYAQREAAAAALAAAEWTPAELIGVLERDTLSAEQRHRLLTAYEQRVLFRPRGALGITMQYHGERIDANGEIRPAAIVVTSRVEGMPAEEVLHLGDRITHIDGKAPTSNDDLIEWVQSKLPGEMVHLTVLRARIDQPHITDTIEIDMELGSAVNLNEPASALASNEVINRRQRDVQQVRRLYGAHRPKIETAHIWIDGPSGFDPDMHTVLRVTQSEIDQIEAGRRVVDARLIREWQIRADQLMVQIDAARDPELAGELIQVLDHYTHIIKPYLMDD